MQKCFDINLTWNRCGFHAVHVDGGLCSHAHLICVFVRVHVDINYANYLIFSPATFNSSHQLQKRIKGASLTGGRRYEPGL